ncbi:MAG: hypothetical protein JWP27_796 [Flaviaesturariibacter sp.]|nr:hypothetical protein [Flaviaesturariibacter sp.]
MNQAWLTDRETAVNAKGAEGQRNRKEVPLCPFARFVASWFRFLMRAVLEPTLTSQ